MFRRLRVTTITAIVCLGIAGGASAQGQLLTGAGPIRNKATVTYTGPGDIVSGATAWYGLRAYSAAVAATGTQSAVDLRRASDSGTCTAKIATNGSIDLTVGTPCAGATVTAFCNATSCFVSKWYDQSGNTKDASQVTAASQPQLVLSAGPVAGLPHVLWSGSQSLTATIADTGAPISASTVWIRTNPAATNRSVIGSSSGNSYLTNGSANQVFAGMASSFLTAATANDNVWHATQTAMVSGASASTINVDGSSSSGTTTSRSSGTTLTLGNAVVGKTYELGIWQILYSAGNMTSLNTNEHAIGGGW